ncbi:unannotated protein [freshwater metagenome]|uniref:Unannotated protein n=1 Tax=freshwater metagenome TaxID=449393 RepID=A0A6J7DDR8_9ZZZZ|nr:zinc-binding dehydrogenase [Actinomycetota bacterium]
MQAITYAKNGPSSVLELRELPDPEPGPGEVRVRVAFSGINPVDWKLRAGLAAPPEPFAIPGFDGAGVIDAVGEGVAAARIGERVWLHYAIMNDGRGTSAQMTVVPEAWAVPLPENASMELGASLGIPALTAHRALTTEGSPAGKTVLVTGGAGAVGHAAIQLGRWMGARVIATASTDEKAALAQAAGAEAVIRYREPDSGEQLGAAAPDGLDLIVDVSLARNLPLDLAHLRPHATIVAYADDGGTDASVPILSLILKNTTLRFISVTGLAPETLAAAVEGVSGALADGALQPPPVHPIPLAQAASAHDLVEAGTLGKVLLEIG